MPPDVGEDKPGTSQGVWGTKEKEPPQRPIDEEGDVVMAVNEEEQEEEDSDREKGKLTTDSRSLQKKYADLDWLFQSQYNEAQ